MIASLPMYDRPSNQSAHDRLWALIRDNLRASGIAAPDALDRTVPYRDGWGRDDLVVGHICNLPYRADFRGKVTLIGASDYGLPHCPPGYFHAVLVARRDDTRDRLADFADSRLAANAKHSYSGFAAAMAHARKLGVVLPEPIITGSHDASLTAVAAGRADLASLDAQTWAMQQTDHPDAVSVRVIAATDPAPGISFITRAGQDPAPYFAAIRTAIGALAPPDRALLGLRGIVALPASAYDFPLDGIAAA